MWRFTDPFRGKTYTFSDSDIHYDVARVSLSPSSPSTESTGSSESNGIVTPKETKVDSLGIVLMSLKQAKATLRCEFDSDVLVTSHLPNDKNKSNEKIFENAKEKFDKGYRSDKLGDSLVNYCLWKKRIAIRTHSSRADEAEVMAAECYKAVINSQ